MPMLVPKLRRVLKLPTVAFIAIGFMIGGGVFVFTGIVFRITGPALPAAYALAVIPVFISMMPLAMLGSAIPTTGASYRYPSRMVSPGLAFVGVWVYAWASFFGQIPLYALGCARYAQTFLPSVSPTLLAAGLVTVFYVVNLLGVRLAAQLQGLLVIILIAALIYYAGSGLARLNPSNFSSGIPNGMSGLALGTALLTFTYFGANGIIELGGEIVNPGKVIPRSFIIAFVTVLLIYVAVAVATVGAVSPDFLKNTEEPLLQVCRQVTGPVGVVFFTLGGAHSRPDDHTECPVYNWNQIPVDDSPGSSPAREAGIVASTLWHPPCAADHRVGAFGTRHPIGLLTGNLGFLCRSGRHDNFFACHGGIGKAASAVP